MAKTKAQPALRIRIGLGANRMFGPGKADLLEHISATGSISAAARLMRMSYKRAWQLVKEMNGYWRFPLVASATGGAKGGGATLTKTGLRVLESYRAIQRLSHTASVRQLKILAHRLA